MTSEEKVFKILMAETDDDIYQAIGKLTDKQKDIVIFSLVKTLRDAQGGKGLFAPVG